MGKIPDFTQEQLLILDEVNANKYLTDEFYFTGGTALNHLYLGHRYSHDIDLLSPHKFDTRIVNILLKDWSKKLKFT